MVRREIKNFELVLGGERYACTVPFSVRSVLSLQGMEAENIDGVACFESDIQVDNAALTMRNFYLRVRGIGKPARIYLGDRLICEADGKTPSYNINVAGLLKGGSNILSIRFDSSAVGDLSYVGISESVEILRFSGAIIDRVSLTQGHSEEGVSLGISLDLIGDASSVRAVATLVSSSGQIYYAGLTKGKGSIAVKDPLYWWPKGHGVQNLYRLTVSLYGEADIEDSTEIRLGLRTADLDGENLVINGLKLVPMGAVYIPDGDPDTARANEKAARYVTAAAMSNYNCLLIPLGAPGPTEKFYELCDVHGITVIEEHSAIDGATVESVRHRSNHPSLCLIDLIGEGNRGDEIKRLADCLPDMRVRVLDSQPEYLGLPALPSMQTVRAVIPEDERSLFSHSIEAIAEEGAIRDMLLSVADRYPYPADLSAFAYASALASAHKVGDAIKSSRLSLGNSGRSVFYRLNDREAAISASAIDCRGRWKPLQYYASRFFAPVTLYADFKDGVVTFSASSQRRIDLVGSLEYRIADASNVTVYKNSVDCEIGGMTALTLHTAEIGEYITGHEREYYLEYCIKEGSSIIGHATLLFVPEKHFAFKKPKIKAVITGQDRRFSLTVASDAFVKDMEIGFDGVDVVLENNYIDITSEAPVKINFTVTGGMETAFHLKDLLEMRSVVDLK